MKSKLREYINIIIFSILSLGIHEYNVQLALCSDISLQNAMSNSSLQMASLEHKKADENVLKLLEEQKVCVLSLLLYVYRMVY